MDVISYYAEFVKPVSITIPTPEPVVIKSTPLMWWWPIPHEDRGIGNGVVLTGVRDSTEISFCTEESYVVRPNETEMQMRMVEILSEGIYSYLKKSGRLKEVQCGIREKISVGRKRVGCNCFRGLTEKKDLS